MKEMKRQVCGVSYTNCNASRSKMKRERLSMIVSLCAQASIGTFHMTSAKSRKQLIITLLDDDFKDTQLRKTATATVLSSLLSHHFALLSHIE
jgi:hypothetical protein